MLKPHYREKKLTDHENMLYINFAATTPDKTVETFQCNFQFRAMQSSCQKEQIRPPPHPCCNVVLA